MITEVVRKRIPPPPEEGQMIDLYLSVRFTIHRIDYSSDERKAVDAQFAALTELLKHPALDRALAREMQEVTERLLKIWMHNGVLLEYLVAIEDATESGTLGVHMLAQAHLLLSKTRDEFQMPHNTVDQLFTRLDRCAQRAHVKLVRGRRIHVT